MWPGSVVLSDMAAIFSLVMHLDCSKAAFHDLLVFAALLAGF
jgi:hypothetical protein